MGLASFLCPGEATRLLEYMMSQGAQLDGVAGRLNQPVFAGVQTHETSDSYQVQVN